MKLSVVLATHDEEDNIGSCLDSIRSIADEIIVFDEASTDKTVEIAKKYRAKVTNDVHKTNFHETKEKGIETASGDWILQLDADERVSKQLAKEIRSVIENRHSEFISESILEYNKNNLDKLFLRHQKLIEQREGHLGKPTKEVVAFFVPRRNYFLGKPLIHAGAYPDGVIRLFKKGKAKLPGKSVHELMEVDGEVEWLYNDLEHHDSPTLNRYLDRMNRYTDLFAKDLKNRKVPVNYWNLFKYSFPIPISYFLKLYIRHKGFLDGMPGFVWSLFSALHFPLAYFKYWQMAKEE